MTQVTTLEELTELDNGVSVVADDVVWTKTDGRFKNSYDIYLPVEAFVGAVHSGLVRVGKLFPAAPAWVRDGEDHWYIYTNDRNEDGTAKALHFRGQEYLSEVSLAEDAEWTPAADGPVHRSIVFALTQQMYLIREYNDRMAAQSTENDSLREDITRLHNRPTFPPDFVSAIQQAVAEDDDGMSVMSVLRDYAIAPTETINVTVEVTGQTLITGSDLDADVMRDVAGGSDVEVTDHEEYIRMYWTWSTTVPVAVQDGDCGCDQVTMSMVQGQSGFPTDVHTWEMDELSCPNCE